MIVSTGTGDLDLLGLAANVQEVIDRVQTEGPTRTRPCVTLTYAQSLDGSIASCPGIPVGLSGSLALDFTHQLRAMHSAILVGINTVLADDPQLTVRRVSGTNPRPVVVDSRLRIPLGCRLLQRPEARPIVATILGANPQKAALLAEHGVDVWQLPATASGGVELSALFARLGDEGVRSVMVEGGARVITSIVALGLADQLMVTIAPRLLGGMRAFDPVDGPLTLRQDLVRVRYLPAGDDLLVYGEFA